MVLRLVRRRYGRMPLSGRPRCLAWVTRHCQLSGRVIVLQVGGGGGGRALAVGWVALIGLPPLTAPVDGARGGASPVQSHAADTCLTGAAAVRSV